LVAVNVESGRASADVRNRTRTCPWVEATRERENLAHFSEVCDRVGYYMVQTLRCKQQITKRKLEKQMQLEKKKMENHNCILREVARC
jgi:hypothetical protein